jgi:hypothetical protein
LICSTPLDLPGLQIVEDLRPWNFRDPEVKTETNRREKALSVFLDEMLKIVGSKIQETTDCGVLLYDPGHPWVEFQKKLNAFQKKFHGIITECDGIPKNLVEAFSSANYNKLVQELNALAEELCTLDRNHQIAKLHAYVNQYGIFNAWIERRGRGILSLTGLSETERNLRALLQMGK